MRAKGISFYHPFTIVLTETRQPTSPPILRTVLGYVFSVQSAMPQKALAQEVKLLNKVKKEK